MLKKQKVYIVCQDFEVSLSVLSVALLILLFQLSFRLNYYFKKHKNSLLCLDLIDQS